MADEQNRGDQSESRPDEQSHHDRAPYQHNQDRNPVKAVEETRDIPTQGHGAVK